MNEVVRYRNAEQTGDRGEAMVDRGRGVRVGTGLLRGAAAGAAGATALNAVTYLDMAVCGRGTSDSPQQVVEKVADAAGVDVPGSGASRESRLAGLGPLTGSAVGVGVGAAVGCSTGDRPAGAGCAAGRRAAAAAMLLADLPMRLLGISDPAQLAAKDWAADALPHLALGGRHRRYAALRRALMGPYARAVLAGAATGARTFTGLALLTLATRAGAARQPDRALGSTVARLAVPLAAAGELVLDKLPQTPSRLAVVALGGRLLVGAGCGVLVGRRYPVSDLRPMPPFAAEADVDRVGRAPDTVAGAALLGLAAAAVTAVFGSRWPALADDRLGSDWVGALMEDLAAFGLAGLAIRS